MRPTVLDCRPEPRECDIQKAAYFLWIELGRPRGRDLELWLAAKEKLLHRHAGPERIHNSMSAAPPRRRLHAEFSVNQQS